jgi:hypothetical protein
MTVTTGSDSALDALRKHHHDLICELRDVDHWRRLVAARMDLAVAAVTSISEPVERDLPSAPPLPCGLKAILGLPAWDEALEETALVVRLRDVLRDLDQYACALRASSTEATRCLSDLDDDIATVHHLHPATASTPAITPTPDPAC